MAWGLAGLALAAAAPTVTAQLPPALGAVEVRSSAGVVVANTREAAEAGAMLLRAGGNAVDAAAAAALALGVSEPEASGLGGSVWMLIHLARGVDIFVDGSAAVPAAADPDVLEALRTAGVNVGYASVAVPGGLAAIAHAVEHYGTRPFAEVVAPAVALAENGIILPPHGLAVLENFRSRLLGSPTLTGIFLDESLVLRPADPLLCQPALARTLRVLARLGAAEFYRGEIAATMAADITANGGFVHTADLEAMRALERAPLHGRYRGFDIVASPPPGAGAAVIEALHILGRFPPERLAAADPGSRTLTLEAVRIALADLLLAVAHPPLQALLVDKGHAARRATLIRGDRALRADEIVPRPGAAAMRGSTHLSVVDAAGNAVSLSQSINHEFGAGVATPELGFPYNSSLSLFDGRDPSGPFYPRPGNLLSPTMAPMIVLRHGRPMLVIGSPGSSRIVSVVTQVIVNVVDRGMSLADAVAAPRTVWAVDGSPHAAIEVAGVGADETVAALERFGYPSVYTLCFPPRPIDLMYFGGANCAGVDPRTGDIVGVGDPRRAGWAASGDPR